MSDELYMRRCLDLAACGNGYTAPNPMVGCVIVHDGTVIGEGWHRAFGGAHAEVEAVNSVADRSLLRESTLYVNLEPCSHRGKTPPCADMIVEAGIPRVVAGMADPNPLVAGRGIERLRKAGVEVTVGVLEEECRAFNAKFVTYITHHRPHITLKWAQTIDGYIDNDRAASTPPTWMTGRVCKTLVNRMRASNAAIMAGANTILRDDPSLRAGGAGPDPLRVVVDRSGRVPHESKVFPALTITSGSIGEAVDILYEKGVQSLFVEGGAELFRSFIEAGLWDEAYVFIAPMQLRDLAGGRNTVHKGVKAPEIMGKIVSTEVIDGVTLIKTSNI